MQERWYEKLHEWEKALNAYERQQEKSPDDTNFLYGRMRCLEALGEWFVFVKIITSAKDMMFLLRFACLSASRIVERVRPWLHVK